MGDLIGVFGGTFDPPHLGHCILAEEAIHQLDLARIYWVPAGQPPHKPDRPITAVEDRFNMVNFITSRNFAFECSRVDMDREGPHYAKDTLQLLQKKYPDEKLVYLMGADSLRDLPLWKDPELFVERTHSIGIMQRPYVEYDLESLQADIPNVPDKLQFFPAPLIDISGKMIRERIKAGSPFRYMVSPEVHAYILDRNLYR
jgi:nicotinate-nucleotide adenylyltransferase